MEIEMPDKAIIENLWTPAVRWLTPNELQAMGLPWRRRLGHEVAPGTMFLVCTRSRTNRDGPGNFSICMPTVFTLYLLVRDQTVPEAYVVLAEEFRGEVHWFHTVKTVLNRMLKEQMLTNHEDGNQYLWFTDKGELFQKDIRNEPSFLPIRKSFFP
jgi:hypothetical protein